MSTSRYALMVYPHSNQHIFNIGDYVQSLAARQFLPRVDTYIEREHLDERRDVPVKMIMNGWYMHNPEHWPPAPEIDPLFVALHINRLAEKEMLDKEGVEYLKAHEPIGCRDYYTRGLLESKGVEAYFSGCMTLTLGRTYRHEEVADAPIYLTDLYYTKAKTRRFKAECLAALATHYRLLRRIRTRMSECGMHKSLRSVAAFWVTYRSVISEEVMQSANYLEQEIADTFSSDDEKFDYADKLLKGYAKARYVVTSRIHCALPCLAMGTPVVFLTDESRGEVHNCRLDGLRQLFHTIAISGDKIQCDIPGISCLRADSVFKNKEDYRQYASDLEKRCEEFMKSQDEPG